MRSTKVVIYKDNFINNINVIRSVLNKNTKLCITVKANGYGSNSVVAAESAVKNGAYCVAVATVSEAKVLREGGITCPILLLSLCNQSEIQDAVNFSVSPFVQDSEYVHLFEEECVRQKKNISVHLAVDTGMGRLGCTPLEAPLLAKTISSFSHISLGGTCTHFAISDELSEEARLYTEHQFSNFSNTIDLIQKSGIDPGIKHCSASSATFSYPHMHFDMVRAGISYYGYSAGARDASFLEKKSLLLKPVMSFQTQVSSIKSVQKGTSISYGCTWKAEEDCDIALLPVGYADGLLRRLSPGLLVSINKKNYPVVGRICMDQCMVNLGKNSGVRRWDDAIIFGPEESGALQNAEDIAKKCGTISYEILTSISSRVPRTVV